MNPTYSASALPAEESISTSIPAPSLEMLEVNDAGDVYEYLLWNVQLTLSLNNRVEKYIFHEMTW